MLQSRFDCKQASSFCLKEKCEHCYRHIFSLITEVFSTNCYWFVSFNTSCLPEGKIIKTFVTAPLVECYCFFLSTYIYYRLRYSSHQRSLKRRTKRRTNNISLISCAGFCFSCFTIERIT